MSNSLLGRDKAHKYEAEIALDSFVFGDDTGGVTRAIITCYSGNDPR